MADDLAVWNNLYHNRTEQIMQLRPAAQIDWPTTAQDLLCDKESQLDDDEFFAMCDLFNMDIQKARTYVGLEDSCQSAWVRRELSKMHY